MLKYKKGVSRKWIKFDLRTYSYTFDHSFKIYFFKNEVILILIWVIPLLLQIFAWNIFLGLSFPGTFYFHILSCSFFLENLSPYTSVLGVLMKRYENNTSVWWSWLFLLSKPQPSHAKFDFQKKVYIWSMNMHRWGSFQRRWSLPSFQFFQQNLLGLVAVIGIFYRSLE